jgi:tetratricopeptide (TPR) repeat protein
MRDFGEMVYQDEGIRREKLEAERMEKEKEKEELEALKKNQNARERAMLLMKEKAKLVEPMFRARGVQLEKEEEEVKICLDPEQYADIAFRLMEIQEYEGAKIWCDRALENYPEVLSSYQCKMKLLFILEDKQGFLDTLKQLKKSGIVINNETLEMIRVFQW